MAVACKPSIIVFPKDWGTISLESGRVHQPSDFVPPFPLVFYSSSGRQCGRQGRLVLGCKARGIMVTGSDLESRATCRSVSLAKLLPLMTRESPFWWPQQCMTATFLDNQIASSRADISSLFFMDFSSVVSNPYSLYMAPTVCVNVYFLTFSPP